jgi:hypothetical protein
LQLFIQNILGKCGDLRIFRDHFGKVDFIFHENPNFVDDNEIKKYIEFLADKLKIEQPNDWYMVSRQVIKDIGGKLPEGSMELLFEYIGKYYALDEKKFKLNVPKKSQRWLKTCVYEIFPGAGNFSYFLSNSKKFLRTMSIRM